MGMEPSCNCLAGVVLLSFLLPLILRSTQCEGEVNVIFRLARQGVASVRAGEVASSLIRNIGDIETVCAAYINLMTY
eukprot:1152661-Pelagomonas_calceolata.AAC.2